MIITALGGWNNLVILPDPEHNRHMRRVRRSLGEGGRRKKNG
jgi:hypothetical protein